MRYVQAGLLLGRWFFDWKMVSDPLHWCARLIRGVDARSAAFETCRRMCSSVGILSL